MKNTGLIILILFFAVFAALPVAAAPGDLDTTFSADLDGYDIYDAGMAHDDTLNAVAVDGSNRIVVAGYVYNGSNYDFLVMRYLPDGTLDTTFDGDGIVTTNVSQVEFFNGFNDQAFGVAIQSDGKIVVAGSAGNGADYDFALVRYNADGSLDTTFGGNGVVINDLSGNTDAARAVAIHNNGTGLDGKIVAVGFSGSGFDDFAVARYNPDGSLDTDADADPGVAFNGSQGYILSDVLGVGYDDKAYAGVIDSSDRVVAAGYHDAEGNYDFAVGRYLPDGTLDPNFAGGVIQTYETSPVFSNDVAFGVAVQGDGKIVAAGYANNDGSDDVSVLRLLDDGTIDTGGFNAPDGFVVTDIYGAGTDNRGSALALQADGKILVGGWHIDGGFSDFALLRYLSDGAPDPEFGMGGEVTTDFAGVNDNSANALAIDNDGKAVLVGDAYASSLDSAVARYEGGGGGGGSWDMTTVEPGVLDAGEPDVDLLIDSCDVPHIAYYRYSLNQLGYAQDAGSGWVVETAASGSYADGDEPSLAIDPFNGYPSITYGTHGEGTAGDTTLYCTFYDGASWSPESVDYWMSGLSGTSHAYDGGDYPVAAYINAETYEAVYAEFDGFNWNQSVIDSDANNAAPSLAFTPASDPAVAFEDQDGPSSALVYTWYDGSSWNPEQVDIMPSAMGIDLAFTPGGYPAISYLAGTAMVDLYYAVYDGSSWNTETVVTNPLSVNTDLEFDADGYPVICYVNNNALELQRWDGATWQQETVHSDALEDAALDFLADGRAMIAAGNSSGDLLVFTESGGSSPSDYYVNINTGSDITGDGSAGNPWQTLHYAVTQLTAGDTLHVAAGTYSIGNGETDGPLVINNDNITIQGAGAGQTTVDGSGAASWVSGFEIVNSTDNFYLTDLEIGNFLTSGIQINQTTNTKVFLCDLHDNSQGVRLLNCDNTNAVVRNKICDNSIGVYIYGDMTDCSPDIINNLIYEKEPNAMMTGIMVGGVGTGGAASPRIYHNTIDSGMSYGIALEQDVDTLTPDIRYNNITGFDYGIFTILGTPAPVLDYNNVWGHATANYSGDLTPGPHCISADPLYTNPAGFDYHLPTDSPSVDTAIGSPLTTDLDGHARPLGAAPDMGCYEHEPLPFTGGIRVSPTSDIYTTEDGGSVTFTVVLQSQPQAPVDISLYSDNPDEGTAFPTGMTFNLSDWSIPQPVTVTGVDDSLMDGDVVYHIITEPAVSGDDDYDGLNPADVTVTNLDNEAVAGITVHPTDTLSTAEEGTSDTFTVVLNKQPAADVNISLSSSDTGEGTVSPSSLSFTPDNWDTPQTVTVTGVDDNSVDGFIDYTIILHPAGSSDAQYDGLDAPDVSVVNRDNDIAGVSVDPAQGLTTTEGGGSDTFTVVLETQPAAEVRISLSSSDTGEVTVSPASLTFTPGNWDTPQTVTVTGVDDSMADGDVSCFISTTVTSDDANYGIQEPPDVKVTNLDDDRAGILVSYTSALKTSQSGGNDTFTVVLGSQPTAMVEISLASSDPDAGIVSPQWLTFTPDNWNEPQTVTVFGQDNMAEKDMTYTVVIASAISDDGGYDGLDPEDVSVIHTDNLPPDPPQYVSPAPFQLFAPGDTITLQAGAFFDPEGDGHQDSYWFIRRADRNAFGCSDYPDSFVHLSTDDLTAYTLPAEDLTPGLAYEWIVGYRDAGSKSFTWSDNGGGEVQSTVVRAVSANGQSEEDSVKNVFIVGYQQTDEAPPLPPGITAADYRMLSCQHHIPDNPAASAVIGDDLAGGYDAAHYRIGAYDPQWNGGDYREYPDFSLYPGGAVWFLARNGLTVDIQGVPVTITEDVDVPLKFNSDNNNGWNMIGPPNDRNYRWSDVEVVVYDDTGQVVFGPERIANLDETNPYVDIRLWEWIDGAYAEDTTMLISGYGYWVRAKQKNVNLRFSVSAQACLDNPDVLLAAGMDNARAVAKTLLSPAEALADAAGSDSPPRPMDAIGNDDGGGGFGSSSGGNCFIGVLP